MILAALILGAQGLGGGGGGGLVMDMQGVVTPVLACPVMGTASMGQAEIFDYKGVRYFGCCAGCADKFAADPEKYIRDAVAKKLSFGYALYDPVSRRRLKPMPNLASVQYQGVRYTFENPENKAKFLAASGSYATAPAKEALHCPVNGVDTREPGSAPSYFDADGIRIYLCCDGCINPTKLHPEVYAKQARPTASNATVHVVTAEDLKKEAELLR